MPIESLIGKNAFLSCISLKSIEISDSVDLSNPNRVISTSYFMFYGCSSLTSITIP